MPLLPTLCVCEKVEWFVGLLVTFLWFVGIDFQIMTIVFKPQEKSAARRSFIGST